MPIGLLQGAARRADRLMGLAGTIGPLLAGARLGMLAHLPGMEVGIAGVAYVLEDEGLAAIAYDHPLSGSDIDLLHRLLPRMLPAPLCHEAVSLDNMARLRNAMRRELGSAMAWISSR